MGRKRGRYNKEKHMRHWHSNFDCYVNKIVVTDMDDVRQLADEIHGKKKGV